PHVQRLRIAHFVPGHEPWPKRAEAVAALALVPGAAALDLEFALGDVVADEVAGDIVERLLLRHIARRAADGDGQFDLPVGLLRVLGNGDGVVGAGDRTDSLREDNGFLGRCRARFGGVIGIVEADGDDLADARDRRTKALLPAHHRQALDLQPAQRLEAGRRQRRAVDLLQLLAEVAQLAVAVDQARLFLPGPAIAHQFHLYPPEFRSLCAAQPARRRPDCVSEPADARASFFCRPRAMLP